MNKTDEINAALRKKMGPYYRYFESLENLQGNPGIQARMPFDLIIE